MRKQKPTSFRAFYIEYLAEHQQPTCRLLHFIGTGLVIFTVIYALTTQRFVALAFVPIIGYGFAWVGHYFFERNKPKTFERPFFSLAGDFVMFWDILSGKESINPKL